MWKLLMTPAVRLVLAPRETPSEDRCSQPPRRCERTAAIRFVGGTGLLLLSLLSATGCTVPAGDPGTLEGAVIDGVTSGITDAIGALLQAFIITVAT